MGWINTFFDKTGDVVGAATGVVGGALNAVKEVGGIFQGDFDVDLIGAAKEGYNATNDFVDGLYDVTGAGLDAAVETAWAKIKGEETTFGDEYRQNIGETDSGDQFDNIFGENTEEYDERISGELSDTRNNTLGQLNGLTGQNYQLSPTGGLDIDGDGADDINQDMLATMSATDIAQAIMTKDQWNRWQNEILPEYENARLQYMGAGQASSLDRAQANTDLQYDTASQVSERTHRSLGIADVSDQTDNDLMRARSRGQNRADTITHVTRDDFMEANRDYLATVSNRG